jgi:hypothetical protein
VLFLWVERDVGIAEVKGSRQEVPALCDGGVVRNETAPLGIRRVRESAIHEAPFTVDQHCVPPVIGTGETVKIKDIAWVLEEAPDDLRM